MSESQKSNGDAGPLVPFTEIRRRGETLLEGAREFNGSLCYDEASVKWLDGFIARNLRNFSDADNRYGAAMAFGYALGEAMIRAFGGTWEYVNDQGWGVRIESLEGIVFPIGMAHKHLLGELESMSSKFQWTRKLIAQGGLNSFVNRAEVGPSCFFEIRLPKDEAGNGAE